jgi:hypothetical protein
MSVFEASLPPLRSRTLRRLVEAGWEPPDAEEEVERLRDEWRAWDDEHGAAWRWWHGWGRAGDEAHLAGGGPMAAPPDPPGLG